MNPILTADAVQSNCPVPWCDGHLPTETGVVHVSAERTVTPTAGGPAERTPFYVSIEHVDSAGGSAGSPAIRLEGSGEPLAPVEAFELGHMLQAAAIAALLGQVTR